MIRAPGAKGALLAAMLAATIAWAQTPEPAEYRMDRFRAPVPETLAGAEVVDDKNAFEHWRGRETAFIDVLPRPPKPENLPEGTIWRRKPRLSIPGSVWLPNVGYGALHAETEAYFRAGLKKATGGDASRAVLFFCLADCWMSWNAAKRALEYGYSKVLWYPGGTDSWVENGWPTEVIERFEPPKD